MRGIVPKNIENCKKKLLLQKLRQHSQSFQFFVHGVSNAVHAHRFFCMRQKLLKCTNLCAPFPHRPRC